MKLTGKSKNVIDLRGRPPESQVQRFRRWNPGVDVAAPKTVDKARPPASKPPRGERSRK